MAYPRFQRARAHKYVKYTGGDLALSSATWVNLSTEASLSTAFFDIVLRAQAGDTIEYGMNALWSDNAVDGYVDVMTVVASAGVHWFGSGEPTTSSGSGVNGWWGGTGIYAQISGSVPLTLVSGDIASGTVTLRPRYRGQTGGNKTIFAGTDDIFQLWAKNLGPEES